jgi:nucleoside-diphosphate-sugar epimerase
MNCLVSGSHGFLGEHLCRRLEQSGHKIYKLPRELLLGNPEIGNKCIEFNPDFIFHLASYGNHHNQTEMHEVITVNILKTWILLEATKILSYKAFINVGSSSEYGNKLEPMRESDVLEPITMYGASKAAATALARGFAHTYIKPIVTVRPFSIYGPGEADFRFIPTVIKSIKNNKELELSQGDHDWVYVDDVVSAMLLISDNAMKYSGEVINIGTGLGYTNHFIVRAIENIMGKKAIIKEVDNTRLQDSKVWLADNKRLLSLGWSCKTIFDGLKETIKYYIEKYDNLGKQNN